MTALLGKKFPRKIREGFARRKIKIAAVLRLHVPHTNPPKIKRFVIIGIRNDIGTLALLFINSKMNPRALESREIARLQLVLLEKDCEFLDHDSYLDCSRLYEWEYEKLVEKLASDVDVLLGNLSESQLEKAKNLIKSARTIERRKKRMYNLL